MKLLFIAPSSNLSANAEFMRIARGTTFEILDGPVTRNSLETGLKTPYDAVHFCGHGGKSVLQLFDGLIDATDLASMMDAQGDAKFIFINACESLAVATAVHNKLHIPCVSHDAEIEDVAAVRFAERYYGEYRRGGDVQKAFDAAKETLLRLFPSQSGIPQLINGDMGTKEDYAHCMDYLTKELDGVFEHFNRRLDKQDAEIAEIKKGVAQYNQRPNKVLLAGLALLFLLVVEQGLTPWLNSLFAAIH